MEIKEIKIENIKGFGTIDNVINVNIKPNKYNLLVAPNGFGKSSIAMAFNGLKKTRLAISDDNKHNQNDILDARLEIKLDNGTTLAADSTHNDISSVFKVFVISNPVTVRATAPRKKGFAIPHGELIVEPIIIETNIPKQIDLGYSYKNMKKNLKSNKGLLPNISYLLDDSKFYECIEVITSELEKFEKTGTRRDRLLNNVIKDFESFNGKNLEEIKSMFSSESLDKLSSDVSYNKILDAIKVFCPESYCSIEKFFVFYQLIILYRKDKAKFKNKCIRAEYELTKKRFNVNLKSIDTTGRKLKASESKGKLMIKFPKANLISNGQRDLLSLYSKLFYFKSNLRKGKKYLLIIDEVFDYLDDANFIAAQYYLSDIVNEHDSDIFVVLLTHLSPRYFHSNIFSKKKLNIQFLDKSLSTDESQLNDLINLRNSIDSKSELYNDISKYLFHYYNQSKDLNEVFRENDASEKCIAFSSSSAIRQYAFDQLDKYKSNETYDCIGVALAIRIKIEETFYNKITRDEDKEKFLDTHSTKKKLDFVEDILHMEIPDAYRLLSPIYNYMHENSDFYRIASSLTNKVVQRLIKGVFK